MFEYLVVLLILQMIMNLLKYSITLMNLFNFKNFCVMSTGVSIHAMCTFLISSLCVEVLILVVGQLDDSCESHCGLFHHSLDVTLL